MSVERPVIIQGDQTVLLEVHARYDHARSEEGRDILSRFAELDRSRFAELDPALPSGRGTSDVLVN